MDTIYYSNCPVPNAFLIAVRHFPETFAAVGVRFELLPPQRSATHFAFDHPSYSRFGGEIPPLLSEGTRAPGATRLIGLTPCRSRQGFLVRPDDPARTAADLAGRRIGITPNGRAMLDPATARLAGDDPWEGTQRALGTWEARALIHTLRAAGMTIGQVELIEVRNPWAAHQRADAEAATSFAPKDLFPDATGPNGNPQIRALLERQVDAVFSFLPYIAETERRGYGRLLQDLGTDAVNDFVSAWTVSSALVQERPDRVQAVIDAVVDAAHWAAEHPDETAALHAENFGLSEASVWAALGPAFHRSLEPRLDAECLAILDQTQTFLVSRGLMPRAVALDNWAEPRFLAQASRSETAK
ncbi:2'-hydroxybiphenyl-2-sulfinate desulfinase [Immundisolibacter sp.]|uniref:2'-hydroxybiphenyl-2-sulfinate desulfinase n=1 Tax=Immundisolibacter sp. TaxID=1934948 RepID=UPI003567E3E9